MMGAPPMGPPMSGPPMSGPPYFGPPPPAGFGAPFGGGPPPSRPRRSWVLWAVLGVVAVLVFCGTATVAVALRGDDDKGGRAERKRVAAVTADLATAGLDLAVLPAAKYRGTLTDAAGDEVEFVAQTRNDGATLATIDPTGTKLELMSVAGETYLRAAEAYWRSKGVDSTSAKAFAPEWVKVDSTEVGLDLAAVLAPASLGPAFAPEAFFEDPADAPQLAIGAETTINGVAVVEAAVDGLTAYVTTAAPKRIVRVERKTGVSVPTAPTTPRKYRGDPLVERKYAPQRAPRTINGFRFDPEVLTDAEFAQFKQRFEAEIQKLKTALDSQVQVRANGQITLSPCGPTGCTANVKVTNTVATSNKYIVKKDVTAEITTVMAIDGVPRPPCVQVVTMPAGGSAEVKCSIAYTIPPANPPKRIYITANASARVKAIVEADIQKLLDDIRRDLEKNRTRPDCADPGQGSDGGGPGEWKFINRADLKAKVKAAKGIDIKWPDYQEQISGVKITYEYRHNDVDFDGFVTQDGKPVFVEAKGMGYASKFGDPRSEGYVRAMANRVTQLERQLNAIRDVPDAKLRFHAAERSFLDLMRTQMGTRLPADLYEKIEWVHTPHDHTFTGC